MRGKFALIAADVNGIALYDISRDNVNLKYPRSLNTAFGEDIRYTVVAGICLIEGPFNTPGNLEVFVNGGRRLLHLWLDTAGSWKHPTTRIAPTTAVIGIPSLIQTKSDTKGDFEFIAPAESGGLVQLWLVFTSFLWTESECCDKRECDTRTLRKSREPRAACNFRQQTFFPLAWCFPRVSVESTYRLSDYPQRQRQCSTNPKPI